MYKSKLFRKIIIIVVLFFSVYIFSISLYVSFFLKDKITSLYIQRANSIANTIAYSLPDILVNNDLGKLQATVNQFLKVPGVGYVLIMDENGEVLVHTFVPSPPTVLTGSWKSQKDIEVRKLEYEKEIFFQVKKTVMLGEGGYVFIGMKKSEIDKQIIAATFKLNSIQVLALFFALFISILTMRKIILPLQKLTEYAQELKKGNFKALFPKKSDDELGYLASVLEEMALELDSFFARLKNSVINATEELEYVINYLTFIMDTMADGLVVTNENFIISQYNASFKNIFKIDQKNLINVNLNNLLGFDLKGNLVSFLEEEQLSTKIEFEYIRKGEKKYIECLVNKANLECEKSLVFLFRDITDRKRIESDLKLLNQNLENMVIERTKKLQELNLRLQKEVKAKTKIEANLKEEKDLFYSTLAAIGEAVITTDQEGNILFMNNAARALVGVDLEKAKNRFFTDVIFIYGEDESVLCPVKEVVRRKKILEKKELYLLTHYDKRVPIDLKVFPIYDRSSKVVGSVVVIRDISERLALEQERLRKEKLQALGVVAGGIAHDFNNLLTVILNNLNILRLAKNKDNVEQNLLKAEKMILRAKQITSQFLTFTKGGEPVRDVVDLKKLIQETVHFLIQGSGIKAEFEFLPEELKVGVDSSQFSQVVENLVINAMQAMQGKGKIFIFMEKNWLEEDNLWGLKQGKYLFVHFRDTGPGVPEELRDKIFEPYFTNKEKGTGLGLASCYSILQRHKGTIFYNPNYTKGAEFVVVLPLLDTEENVSLQETEQEEKKCEPGLFTNKKVLFMDDDEEILEISKDIFSSLGFSCTCVKRGEEVIDLYKKSLLNKEKYDLVIMDLTVPGGMGGKETIKELLKIDPEVRAVVSSGYFRDPVMANYKDYGFKGVLPKPYSLEDLQKLLLNLFAN